MSIQLTDRGCMCTSWQRKPSMASRKWGTKPEVQRKLTAYVPQCRKWLGATGINIDQSFKCAGRKGKWQKSVPCHVHQPPRPARTTEGGGACHISICSCQILHDKICPIIQAECPLAERLEDQIYVLNFIFFNVAIFEYTKWDNLGMEPKSTHKHLCFTHTSHVQLRGHLLQCFQHPSVNASSAMSLVVGFSTCSLRT